MRAPRRSGSKTPDEILEERKERIEKAIELKEPDSVPLILLSSGDVLRKYATGYDLYFNYEKAREAIVRFVTDYNMDMFLPVLGAEGFIFALAFAGYPDIAPAVRFWMGPMHDAIKDKFTKWPGRELPEDSVFQFIGGQFMDVREYVSLIEDPIAFINKVILPRSCINLEDIGSTKANAALIKLGTEIFKALKFLTDVSVDLAKAGVPSLPLTSAYAPLDFIGDFLRTPTGILIDIRRYPGEVKRACEALMEPIIKVALALKPSGAKYAFIPLHLNEYLSPKLYNEFYWPTLKKVIMTLYEQGIKSFVFFEGWHDAHLETILDLPKGWGVALFEKTDVRKAKKVLAGHTCIMGGVLSSLLLGATQDKIKEYIKVLLEEMKPGGGFILANSVDIPKNVPPENLKVLIEAIEEKGRYH
ncbi:MAG: uroporphyrinogen decarboxylase family protein [Candidatus Bathyarchaeia archaeon]